MPSAKPPYDRDESWKQHKTYTCEQWDAVIARLLPKLRVFYPNQSAPVDPTWGHPADDWSRTMIQVAHETVSGVRGQNRRRTNEELRAEQDDLLKSLSAAADKLGKVTDDLSKLFAPGADVLGTRDMLLKLIAAIEPATDARNRLPEALKPKEVNGLAALEMAIECLRRLSLAGGKVSATANPAHGNSSDAVKMLKILGDEFGLCFAVTTWRTTVSKAKKQL